MVLFPGVVELGVIPSQCCVGKEAGFPPCCYVAKGSLHVRSGSRGDVAVRCGVPWDEWVGDRFSSVGAGPVGFRGSGEHGGRW